MKKLRVIYASGGSANLIQAHKLWEAGLDSELQLAQTFSRQIAIFCLEKKYECLMISPNESSCHYNSGIFTIKHLSKVKKSGIRYHITEIIYSIRLLWEALMFRANVAIVDSGATHFFMLLIFSVFRIRLIIILHNTIWPKGYFPYKFYKRFIIKINSLLWRYFAHCTIVVSPAIRRQIEFISPKRNGDIIEFRPQFDESLFSPIPEPPNFHHNPFTIMFVGRADRLKGLMDLAEIAFNVEEKIPNRVRWIVCGDGPDLEDLRRKVIELGIERKFEIMGHTVPSKLIGLYEKVNACIVPTRSEFSEGLAMTVIESVLARRPVITSSVVPALELMRPACLEANTDDCISYADAVISIASDEILYQSLRLSAPDRLREFLSSEYSLVTALCRAFIGIR